LINKKIRTDCLRNSTACFEFAPSIAFYAGCLADTASQPSLLNLQPRVVLTPLFSVLPQMAIPLLRFAMIRLNKIAMPDDTPLI
jgi:hypothetical protein